MDDLKDLLNIIHLDLLINEQRLLKPPIIIRIQTRSVEKDRRKLDEQRHFHHHRYIL